MTKKFALICLLSIPSDGTFADAKKKSCQEFLCEYGPEPSKSEDLKKKLNALITKKVGSDLGEGSLMTISPTSVENFDAPASHEATKDAISVFYFISKPKNFMGNEIAPGGQVHFMVIGEDVQLLSAPVSKWKPFPGRPFGGFCLWTPQRLNFPSGTTYKGLEVIRGEVTVKPYFKKAGHVKRVAPNSKDAEFRYRGVTYKYPASIALKEDGTVFTKEELAKLQQDYADRYKKVSWLPVNDEAGHSLCESARDVIPDIYYDVRFSDTGGVEK